VGDVSNLRVAVLTNFYPTISCPAQGTFIQQQVLGLRHAGVTVEVLHLDRRANGVMVYRHVVPQLLALVNRFSPDLLHVMYGGVLAYRATRSPLAVPILVSFCGSDLLGDAPNGCFRRIIGGLGVLASQQAAVCADGVIVKSAGLRDALTPAVARDKVWVVSNGIDLNRFRPMEKSACERQLNWRPNTFHVLFASGKDNRIKRIELAEAAIKLLQSSGVPVAFHVMRGVPQEEVPVYLNAADALILTSVHEGSPNIVKEALACNRPVVSVDVGDVRERIAGIDGCYIAEPTPESLSKALEYAFVGPGVVEGRTRMHTLSLDAVSRDLVHIYQTVLGRFGHNIVPREKTAYVM
jgi:teichuronic acid biosynthesis glycosyltransferase TuaC